MSVPTPLCSPEWLEAHLFDPDIRVVDGSWHMPAANRNAAQEFVSAHIPGAVHFDVDRIAQKGTELPHMVAPAAQFAQAVGRLGISQQNTIVVYDSVGLMSAARVWWNFKIMGVQECMVLDGGLPLWIAQERPISAGHALPTPVEFVPSARLECVKNAEHVLEAGQSATYQIVDVRSEERFEGRIAEPRPGLRSGHMPGARNLPFADMIANGRLRPPAELSELMTQAGINPSAPAIASCGSGVTAPIFSLALATMGIENLFVYDGSWTEWGGRDDLPVVSGPADTSVSL